MRANHTQVGDALYYLTEFYRKYNRLAEAEPLYTSALSIREKEAGAEYAVSTILSKSGRDLSQPEPLRGG